MKSSVGFSHIEGINLIVKWPFQKQTGHTQTGSHFTAAHQNITPCHSYANNTVDIVGTPPPSAGGGGFEPLTKFSKRRTLQDVKF